MADEATGICATLLRVQKLDACGQPLGDPVELNREVEIDWAAARSDRARHLLRHAMACLNCDHQFDPISTRWRCDRCGFRANCCEGEPLPDGVPLATVDRFDRDG